MQADDVGNHIAMISVLGEIADGAGPSRLRSGNPVPPREVPGEYFFTSELLRRGFGAFADTSRTCTARTQAERYCTRRCARAFCKGSLRPPGRDAVRTGTGQGIRLASRLARQPSAAPAVRGNGLRS